MGGTLGSSAYSLVVAEGFVSAIPGLKIPTRPNNVTLALRDSCRDGTHWSVGVGQGRARGQVAKCECWVVGGVTGGRVFLLEGQQASFGVRQRASWVVR